MREPPLEGRSKHFLGSVGPLKLKASTNVNKITRGQAFEVRLRLEGPGAIGARHAGLRRFETGESRREDRNVAKRV